MWQHRQIGLCSSAAMTYGIDERRHWAWPALWPFRFTCAPAPGIREIPRYRNIMHGTKQGKREHGYKISIVVQQ